MLFKVVCLGYGGDRHATRAVPGITTITAYDQLPVRALQFVGAIALARYCHINDIRHDAVDSLVAHLCKLARVDDFPEWESQLMALPLHGMGDLPPQDVLATLPYTVGGEFHQLVENVVEITMSIAYGKVTNEPQQYLNTVLSITANSGVVLPPAKEFEIPSSFDGFGDAIDDDLYAKWCSFLP